MRHKNPFQELFQDNSSLHPMHSEIHCKNFASAKLQSPTCQSYIMFLKHIWSEACHTSDSSESSKGVSVLETYGLHSLSFSKNYFSIKIPHVGWKPMAFWVQFLEYTVPLIFHVLCPTPNTPPFIILISVRSAKITMNLIPSIWIFCTVVSRLGLDMAWSSQENVTLAFKIYVW